MNVDKKRKVIKEEVILVRKKEGWMRTLRKRRLSGRGRSLVLVQCGVYLLCIRLIVEYQNILISCSSSLSFFLVS